MEAPRLGQQSPSQEIADSAQPEMASGLCVLLHEQVGVAHAVAMSSLANVRVWSDTLRNGGDLSATEIDDHILGIARLGRMAVAMMAATRQAILAIDRLERAGRTGQASGRAPDIAFGRDSPDRTGNSTSIAPKV